jgi:hypothetical protein
VSLYFIKHLSSRLEVNGIFRSTWIATTVFETTLLFEINVICNYTAAVWFCGRWPLISDTESWPLATDQSSQQRSLTPRATLIRSLSDHWPLICDGSNTFEGGTWTVLQVACPPYVPDQFPAQNIGFAISSLYLSASRWQRHGDF